MQLGSHDIAVCSWSLQPRSLSDLVATVQQLGLNHVQLALGDLILLDDKRKYAELGQLRSSGMQLTGGMMSFPGEDYATIDRIRETGGFVPDGEWTLRKRLCVEGAKLAKELGIQTITTHIGFVPPPGNAGYATMIERVRELAAEYAQKDIWLLMETGQEPAAELLHFLTDLKSPNVAINFDPANMILYGAGDPIEAIGVLATHIRHVHVKDATASNKPGVEWGAEVPFGTGQVNAARFLSALKSAGYTGPLAIEREAGNDRIGDVKHAIATLKANL